MLLIPTLLRPSFIEGLGLFAAAPVPKGTITWRFDPTFDLTFTVAEVEAMGPIQRALLRRHGYLSTALGKYVFCTDDARFWNHSAECNNGEVLLPGDLEPANVALRDIAAGEELTVDYRLFDAKDSDAGAAWLKN
ncbi:MAG: SET domain-containing protein [Alphaproteobacteria bacterium]|nr:SET domain-containing protein [Alphaproteobacteria bacterium]